MKTAIPDLSITSLSQPPNLCLSLCLANLRLPPSLFDEPPRPSQSCSRSRCKLRMSLIRSNYITSAANNKTFKCNNENTSCASKCGIYDIFIPSVCYNTWIRFITLELS